MAYGMYQNEYTCQKCNYETHKFDAFSSVPIEIKNPDNREASEAISLESCLEADREAAVIPEKMCRECMDLLPTDSKLTLYKLPPILVFQLKRFKENSSGGFEKVSLPVTYPLEIDMA